MNIGFFTDTYLPQINGVVTSIETFRKELQKDGHRVFLFGPRLYNSKVNPVFDKKNDIHRFYSIPYPRQKEHRIVFPVSPQLWDFKKYKLDIIHSHTYFPMGIYAAYLARRYRLPIVHTYHTLWAEYTHYSFLPKRPTKKAITLWSRFYCNFCDAVISPSEAIKDVLLLYGVKKPIEVLPTGIDTEPVTEDRVHDIRGRYSISGDRKMLSFVGRLGREKNLFFLIRAYKMILEKVPHCRFLIIGDGPEKKKLVKFVETEGLEKSVIFAGYLTRDEVMSALKDSDLFLFASQTETQGLCLIESMVAKTPAVAVDAMGVSEILAGDRGGLLTKADEKDFSAKAIRLLTDMAFYKEKVRETADVVQDFSSVHITRKLINQYQKLIAGRKK